MQRPPRWRSPARPARGTTASRQQARQGAAHGRGVTLAAKFLNHFNRRVQVPPFAFSLPLGPSDAGRRPEAAEDLKALKAVGRAAVRDAMEHHLIFEPTKTSKSRIKRLRGIRRPQYRLRVDDIRIFYDVADKAVEVLAIVAKRDAAAWLARHGSPQTSGIRSRKDASDEGSGAVGYEG